MGHALSQFWSFFTTLFTAAERGAKAIDNLAIIAEETTATYVDETRHNRAAQAVQFARSLAIKEVKAVAAK